MSVRLPAPLALCLLAALAQPAWAQDNAGPSENIREEYARVMAAEPVYQTLRATSMVERCDQSTPVQRNDEQRRGLSRMVEAVKDVLTPAGDVPARAPEAGDCRMVPVDREFRRPIAYDVEYLHRGVKYRSRLPYDPGNRVRVRVSVTPVVSPAGDR
ncbi:hypothetical protein BH23PSE2_BH23PSE2_03960 [soil metagenome]